MLIVLPVVMAYLVGAVPFALIVSRLYGVEDIRTAGSGNLGATNVWRVAGFKAALWVFLGDIGKGIVGVLAGRYYISQFGAGPLSADVVLVACAVAAVVGHVFPIYIGFRGGKGVNTALGAMLMLMPVETVICLGVFLLVLLVSRYVSLGSMAAAVALFAVTAVERFVMHHQVADVYLYLAAILAVLIIVTHRHNISRLIGGTEGRFSLSSRTAKGDS